MNWKKSWFVTGLFGYNNIKFVIIEFIKMYSAQDSFFAKKRIESGIAFTILQWGMIFFMIKKLDKMDSMDLLMWASIEGVICGYMIKQIQAEKKQADSADLRDKKEDNKQTNIEENNS